MNKMLIHEGSYAAEVTYEEFDDGSPFAPIVRKEDIQRIDRVRLALRHGDIAEAAKESKVYELKLLAGNDISLGKRTSRFFESPETEARMGT